MTQIIRPDMLTGSLSAESHQLPIAQLFIDTVNTSPTDRTEDVLRASLEASIAAIAALELRITALTKAVGAVEVESPKVGIEDVQEK
ncbi:hypothetical protein [Microbacterium sp. A93]|uniref:hypothetical protein n=1 Tax=Microbacterium sp. A93 TaxID=3450716 RepID=UPI003F4328A7